MLTSSKLSLRGVFSRKSLVVGAVVMAVIRNNQAVVHLDEKGNKSPVNVLRWDGVP